MRNRLTNILLTSVLVIGAAILVAQMEKIKNQERKAVNGGQSLPASQKAASGPASEANQTAELRPAERSALDVIRTRHSVRHYSEREVEPETLDRLLRAAMCAPTAMNKQPWAFVCVTNTALLRPMSGEGGLGMMKEARAAVLVLGLKDNQFWQQDCSAATENLLLAAEALGLGAVWCAGYPLEGRMKLYKKTFAYPDEYLPLALVAIGSPAEEEAPKDKYKPEKIHFDRW